MLVQHKPKNIRKRSWWVWHKFSSTYRQGHEFFYPGNSLRWIFNRVHLFTTPSRWPRFDYVYEVMVSDFESPLYSTMFPLLLVTLTLVMGRVLAAGVRPLVLWHGMGDSHSSPAMTQFISMVKEVHPDIFVHSIYMKENLDQHQRATWVMTPLSRI